MSDTKKDTKLCQVPERIWLQWVPDGVGGWTETTWCADKINDDDIPYHRERECVWQSGETFTISGFSACGQYMAYKSVTHNEIEDIETLRDWTYCPYCGGRIKMEPQTVTTYGQVKTEGGNDE